MPDSNPLVSVIMAAHNEREHLPAAVESILQQTYPNVELIVVDDASTDETPEYLDALASTADGRVRVLHNDTNLGLTESLNKAGSVAAGKILARLDADDEASPQRIELQVEYMRSHPEIDFLSTEALLISEGGKTLSRSGKVHQSGDLLDYIMYTGSPFVHSTMMFRKAAFDVLDGYDSRFRTRQDLDLWIRALKRGFRFGQLPQALVRQKYRRHSLSRRADDNLVANVVIRVMHLRSGSGGSVPALQRITEVADVEPAVHEYINRVHRARKLIELKQALVDVSLTGLVASVFHLLRLSLSGRRGDLRSAVSAVLTRLQGE